MLPTACRALPETDCSIIVWSIGGRGPTELNAVGAAVNGFGGLGVCEGFGGVVSHGDCRVFLGRSVGWNLLGILQVWSVEDDSL